MMSGWRRDASLRYCSPTPKIILFGVVLLLFAGITKAFELLASSIVCSLGWDYEINFSGITTFFAVLSGLVFLISIIEKTCRGARRDIKYVIRRTLCDSS